MKKNYFLLFIIIISLTATMTTVYERIQVEGENKSVEVVLDYNEIKALARQSDSDLQWWLKKFKDLGAVSVALEEESLESMVKDDKELEFQLLGNIKKDIEWKSKYDEEFVQNAENRDKYNLAIITKSKEIYSFIMNGLEERYPKSFFKGIQGIDNYYVILNSNENEALYTQTEKIFNTQGKAIEEKRSLYSSKVAKIGLGFDEDKVKLIKESGLEVLPRPINYDRYPEALVEAFKNEIDKHNMKPSTIIFAGSQVLGYESEVDKIKDYMARENIKAGMVETSVQREHIEQDGLESLVEALDYNSVRVFSIWPYIQERFKYYNYEGAEEIENTLYRAVTERNIRVIYFKPFKEEEFKYVTDYEEYEKMFNSFEERIKRHGMSLKNASTMSPMNTGPLRLSLIGFGIAAAGILLLKMFFKVKSLIINVMISVGLIGVLGMNYFLPSLADKITSLSASIVFPTLSIGFLICYCRDRLVNQEKKYSLYEILKACVIVLFICTGISLVGGFYTGASLSRIKYLLEMDIFRGVKISQIMPIVLFGILYILKFGYDRDKENISQITVGKRDFYSLLHQNIQVKHIIVLSVLAIVGYIYIARTGHETAIQPSDLEMIVRNFFENVLLARPRTKELFAFPALMVTVYLAFKGYKKLIFPAALAAVIGQSSIANTFSHLRTPIYLSFIRTLFSLGFGAIIGLALIVLLKTLEDLIYSFERRTR